MKTKAEILGKWVIGISIIYPVLMILLFCLYDFIGDPAASFLFDLLVYLAVPVIIVDWLLTAWSLTLYKTSLGYVALFFSLLYLLSIAGIIYLFKDFCVVC